MPSEVARIDLVDLSSLAQAATFFFAIIAFFSIISGVALQAFHEALRSWFNRFVVQGWFRARNAMLSLSDLRREMGYISESSLFSLPYWQVTGQIGATLSSKINVDPTSEFVRAFANVHESEMHYIYERAVDQFERMRAADPDMSTDEREVSIRVEALAAREIAARAQYGVNALHARLRSYWNIFDYYFTLFLIAAISGAVIAIRRGEVHGAADNLTHLIILIGIFSWLATPIVRRMIERLVPFR